MRFLLPAAMLALGLGAAPAAAQVNPALNPTVMVGTAGVGAAGQHARNRAGMRGPRSGCSYYARNPRYRCPPVRSSHRYRSRYRY